MSSIKLPLNLSNKDVLNMLIKISERDDPLLIVAEEKEIVLMIIHELKRGYVDSFFILDEWLKVEDITPPLHLLWALDVENLLKFTTYIYFNKEYCTALNEIVSSALQNDDDYHEEIKKILTYAFRVILNIRHCTYFQFFEENILSSTIAKVLEYFESNSELKWQYIQSLKILKSINSDSLNTFLLDHMSALLSGENSSYEFSFILNNHAKLWIYEKLSPDVKTFLSEVPTIPASCRKHFSEYIALCKTRLSDLNETTDYIGIFNDYYEKDEEGQEADVCRAISIFQENQEIPKPLLEASVFRKQYYEKVFLKRLLSVPESSDAKRAELINKLHSAGKISKTLYNRWVSLSK
ncbi:unnamed protein product [Nezara viridula]|uniref:Fanconi anaemia group A protein helical domain-containing protein n=1 Tax=Nezara viridula TaxID=85310 RepID=A0A9P0HIU0_NEZVI|nr:unnamed protein product [Nezara viridula]